MVRRSRHNQGCTAAFSHSSCIQAHTESEGQETVERYGPLPGRVTSGRTGRLNLLHYIQTCIRGGDILLRSLRSMQFCQ